MSGLLFIVAAPSGAGKTTLVNRLLATDPGLSLSISHTTRKPRAGETEGEAYHFVDKAQFERMIASEDFLEWAEVHGNYYGTSRRWIESQCAQGHDVVLEIDWQGARQVRATFPDCISIFILPPSLEALASRLNNRGTDSREVIERRLAAACEEMAHVREFDYVIINENLQTALTEISAVVHAERVRLRTQCVRHPELFAQLTQSD